MGAVVSVRMKAVVVPRSGQTIDAVGAVRAVDPSQPVDAVRAVVGTENQYPVEVDEVQRRGSRRAGHPKYARNMLPIFCLKYQRINVFKAAFIKTPQKSTPAQ